MKHLIDIMQLTPQEIMELIDTACAIMEHPEQYAHKCDGKILATLFFEPSTRTRLSFESRDATRSAARCSAFAAAESSSASKGESVADTVRVVSCYSDIIAMRHPKEGAPLVASMHAQVPGHQRGRRRPQPPHADADRPSDHLPRKGAAGRPDRSACAAT